MNPTAGTQDVALILLGWKAFGRLFCNRGIRFLAWTYEHVRHESHCNTRDTQFMPDREYWDMQDARSRPRACVHGASFCVGGAP